MARANIVVALLLALALVAASGIDATRVVPAGSSTAFSYACLCLITRDANLPRDRTLCTRQPEEWQAYAALLNSITWCSNPVSAAVKSHRCGFDRHVLLTTARLVCMMLGSLPLTLVLQPRPSSSEDQQGASHRPTSLLVSYPFNHLPIQPSCEGCCRL